MNKLKYLLAVIIIFFYSCKSNNVNISITKHEQYLMIIEDYYKRNKADIKKYKAFSVNEATPDGYDYYLYGILPLRENNPIFGFDLDKKLSFIPSEYIEYKRKLFFILEKEFKQPDDNVLAQLDKLKLLDSTHIKIQLGILSEDTLPPLITTDDSNKKVSFVICKNNPNKIKKRIKTSVYLKPEDELFNVCK